MKKAKTRKTLMAILCAFATACATTGAAEPEAVKSVKAVAAPTSDELILLGTAGGPLARADRSGIATLLTIGGRRYLIDAGEGAVHQLGKADLQPMAVPVIFLTHLHDDHYTGLPSIASFSWTLRSPRLDIYGPQGTADLVNGIAQVMTPNARIRAAEQHIKLRPEDFLKATEYAAGPIFDDGNVRVSAVANTHYDLPPESPAASNKSYSLRFESGGRSIVFTGDTGPSEAVTEFAKGADVLISEMVSLADRASVPPYVWPHMDREHLSPLEVGKMAAAAGVKTLVLSHVGVVGEADLEVIRSVFPGKVILGTDMARIPL